jgi:hypothetical protein
MSFAVLRRNFLATGACVLAVWPWNALAQENLPEASSVIQRVLRRAEETDQAREESKYVYEKRSLSEELDDSGKPIKRNEKVFEVTPIEGVPFSRLIRIQDRDLTEEERELQDRREEDFRRRIAQKRPHARHGMDEDALNSELVERYDFKVEKRDWVNKRAVLVLSFHPKKPHAPEKTVEDRVLNRLAGQVWVDEEEAEVLQVRVWLTEDFSIGLFGMICSIKQCDVKIERQRLPDDVWVKKSFAILLGGRKLLSSMRYRSLEEFYNFRKP